MSVHGRWGGQKGKAADFLAGRPAPNLIVGAAGRNGSGVDASVPSTNATTLSDATPPCTYHATAGRLIVDLVAAKQRLHRRPLYLSDDEAMRSARRQYFGFSI
jgi:hypothetical protein